MNKRRSIKETAANMIAAIRANPAGVAEMIQSERPDISAEEARLLALAFIGLFDEGITEAERNKRQREYCRNMNNGNGKTKCRENAQKPVRRACFTDGDL